MHGALGLPEVIFIFVLALLLFGPRRYLLRDNAIRAIEEYRRELQQPRHRALPSIDIVALLPWLNPVVFVALGLLLLDTGHALVPAVSLLLTGGIALADAVLQAAGGWLLFRKQLQAARLALVCLAGCVLIAGFILRHSN